MFRITNSKAQALALREERRRREGLKFLSYPWYFWPKKVINFSPLHFIGIISEKETNCPQARLDSLGLAE